jgi:hypothetical protein
MKKILAMLCAALLPPHSIADETQSSEDVAARSNWMAFHCDAPGKRHCKDMANCDEATFHWAICGRKGLDSEGDNMPCEQVRLCPRVLDCGVKGNGK